MIHSVTGSSSRDATQDQSKYNIILDGFWYDNNRSKYMAWCVFFCSCPKQLNKSDLWYKSVLIDSEVKYNINISCLLRSALQYSSVIWD